MPVLHKHTDRDSYYILTSIKGNIITFQLSGEGATKLLSAGILPDHKFSRAFLLDLYRTGDAFTHGSGPGSIAPPNDPRQIAFDFPDDPESETLFPACSSCYSINDLHLVEIKDKDHYASLLCDKCRATKSSIINSSLPLPLVTRGILNRLLEMKDIKTVDSSVAAYKKLLDAQFAAKWAALSKGKPMQQSMIDIDDGSQKKLL